VALADLTTGQDLAYYALAHGAQSQSTQDDYYTIVKAAIQKNYWEILELEPWLFALSPSPGAFATVASQSVTISSVTTDQMTLSATIATSQAGKKIYHDSLQTVYRIDAHTAGTAVLTLDATWVETLTSGPATIYQDEYDLVTTAMHVWGPLLLRGNTEHEIELLDDRQFTSRYNNGDWGTNGPPEYARQIPYSSSGQLRVQLAPAHTLEQIVEYKYTKFRSLDFTGAGSGDTPVLPLSSRWVIAERALWDLLRVKNNDLAGAAWNRAEDHLSVMRTRYLGNASRPKTWVRSRNNLGAG
jgi:hypothetical protein